MTNKIKNGDLPAMPIEISGFGQYAPEAHVGLTKREQFAMTAMAGLLANPADMGNSKDKADYAVKCADALLAALEKGNE